MKALGNILLLAVLLLTACEKATHDEFTGDDNTESVGKTKKFTFTLKGDFSDEWKLSTSGNISTGNAGTDAASRSTRGYLQADGRDMTDVWVFDYKDGALIQQLHQSDNTKDDFGQPSMNLSMGTHHIYFVVSRGQGAVLDTDAKTITFSKVLDTFWQDYEVTVVSTSNGNRAVTLDRVVTKLSLTIEDAIPSTASTFSVTPATWYYGMDYTTGQPTTATASQPITLNIPSSSLGKEGESVNVFGFSLADEWTTDVTLSCLTSDNSLLGRTVINDVPLKRNRITEYTGRLFNGDTSLSLGLNSTWNESVKGVW